MTLIELNNLEGFMPKTILGKISLILIIAMPILFFVGASFTNLLYKGVPAGNTIAEDMAGRPALALTMLAAIIAGISAFVTGLIAITKRNEQANSVYAAVIIGAVLILFLVGEFIIPH